MKELLPKKTLDYMERARHVAENAIRPVAADLDRSGEYPWSVIQALRDADLMGIWIPEEYGGHGAGVLDLCVVVEELSKACGGVGVAYAVNALGSFPVIVGGTEQQKRTWLPPVASGERLIAFGLSEKASGSDAGSMRTAAVRDGDQTLSYGDLVASANALAGQIRLLDGGSDRVVMIRCDPGIDYCIAVLGAISAGCFAAPINPGLPEARIKMMFDLAEPVAVIGGYGDDDCPKLGVERRLWEGSEESPAVPQTTLQDPCYALFTSGSTAFPRASGCISSRSQTWQDSSRPGMGPSQRLGPLRSRHLDSMSRSKRCLEPGPPGVN